MKVILAIGHAEVERWALDTLRPILPCSRGGVQADTEGRRQRDWPTATELHLLYLAHKDWEEPLGLCLFTAALRSLGITPVTRFGAVRFPVRLKGKQSQ